MEDSFRIRREFSLHDWQMGGEMMHFAHLHVSELFHCAVIPRSGEISKIPSAMQSDIHNAEIQSRKLGSISFEEYVHTSEVVDGVIIVHQGQIVYEAYPGMRPTDKHLWWSVSKTITSLLIAILENRDLIDVDLPVERYLPEVVGSGWEGVRIGDVLDMASGIDLAENEGTYSDPTSRFYAFESSLGLLQYNERTPESTYAYLSSIPREKEPGVAFDYTSANTFLLAWLAERVTGIRYSELVRQEIWDHIGAEGDALLVVGPSSAPGAHGGIVSTLRDMARYGLLYTPSRSVISSFPVLPERYLNRIQDDGRPEIFGAGVTGPQMIRALRGEEPVHNAWQWDFVMGDGDLFKGGYSGQGLYVSPANDLIIAFFGTMGDDKYSNELVWIARQLATSALF